MDINNVIKEVEQQTNCSTKYREMLINWLKKQNILLQHDVLKEQKKQFFKLKGKYKDSNTLILSAFFLSINVFYQKEKHLKCKNKSQNFSSIKSLSNFAIKKHKKIRRKEKREKLLNIWSVVQNLKAEDFSFRDISKYIASRHRFEVSHTYIAKIWNELNNEL